MAEITTIKLEKKTKGRLEKLKVYKRESYEEVIGRIIDILNICRVDSDGAQERLIAIERAKKLGEIDRIMIERKQVLEQKLADKKRAMEEKREAFEERKKIFEDKRKEAERKQILS